MFKEIKGVQKNLILNGIKEMVTSGQDPTQLSSTCEKELRKSISSERNYQKQKADVNAFERGDQVPAPGSRRTWQCWLCGSGFIVKDTRQGLWNLPSWLRKAAEARSVSEMPLHGGPERPMCKSVKVKSGLCWRPQNIGDARGYQVWNQPIRKKLCSQQSSKGIGDLKT